MKINARWYVYLLIDPLTGAPFYIGKGAGNRVDAHEKEARCHNAKPTKKIRAIRRLWEAGVEVRKEFSAQFWDEQAAYDHETDLIEEIGLENLTNILPGGQKAWERRQAERRTRRRRQEPLALDSVISGLNDVAASRIAEWFRAGGHLGSRWVFSPATGGGPADRISAVLSDSFYNRILPLLWGQIRKCDKSLSALAGRLSVYGVEFAR